MEVILLQCVNTEGAMMAAVVFSRMDENSAQYCDFPDRLYPTLPLTLVAPKRQTYSLLVI